MKVTPTEYSKLKLTNVISLPYTAKNGIVFTADTFEDNTGHYFKNNCKGMFKLNNWILSKGMYGVGIEAVGYWTQRFGDCTGIQSSRIMTAEPNATLDTLALEIEAGYKKYTKF